MKTCKLAAFFIASLSLMAGSAWPRPVDLSAPSGELGAANSKGYLEIWREIDEIGLQLGKDNYLPLRYKFSSDDTIGGMLGPGFYMPMFEAKNVLIREQVMRAYLPCGKGLYFWRDTVDPNKFQTVDKEWSGYLMGDGDFSVWRDDGWKLLYHKSRLTSLVTDDNHTFTWDYDQGGMPTGVSEDGQSMITVEPNTAGQVAAFIFNGKRYEVTYAERPLTQVLLGQTAIKELVQSLASFKYPDGKMETFKFIFTQDRIPTLTFTDKDKKQTLYSWDAATNHIATEKGPQDDWTYTIGAIAQEFGLPPISRTNSGGKTETMAVDTKMGSYTAQAADGSTTITHVFKTPGPLYNRVQKIEKTEKVDGKDVVTQVYRASYDEAGRLIRQIDEKGFITSFTYDDQGKVRSKVISMTQNPEVLASFKKKEKELMDAIADAITLDDKQYAIRSLAQFYLFEMRDHTKALSFLSQLDHKHSYALRVQAIDNDDSLTPLQKVDGYQALMKDYPENKDNLNFLIKTRQEENENENKNG